MKKLLMPLLLSAVIVPAASAQEVNWTGFYAGARAGYATGDSDAKVGLGGAWSSETQALRNDVTRNFSTSLDPKGGAFGLQAGYNYQTASRIVVGAEADIAWLNADDSRKTGMRPTVPFPARSYDYRNEIDVERTMSLRGKVGYAFDKTLVYVTGGWAWAKADMSAAMYSNGGYRKAGGENKTLDGYTVGIGFEHMLSKQLSVRGDYSYTDFGSASYSTAYLPGSTFVSPAYTERIRQDLTLHQFSVGLNYRF